MTDYIKNSIELDAPIDRVWTALTDHREFGAWFRVEVDEPFILGRTSSGRGTFPGYEGCPWQVEVRAMDKPDYFSFAWHPHAVDRDVDYSVEPTTLVEFTLKCLGERTQLTVVESGFDALPEARRWLAQRENQKGWNIQMGNIAEHVTG